MRDDFAAMILTHGRADHVDTVKSLRDSGYTGRVYIVIDDEDDQADEYRRRYGDENVKQFCKLDMMLDEDLMDNFQKHGVVLHARNACFRIAKDLGLKYFIELDDDYTEFCFRVAEKSKLAAVRIKDLDRLLEDMIEFLEVSGAQTVALSQGGDYLGGVNGRYFWKGLSRKAMNSFICRTDRPFAFVGTYNEDVNMYTMDGSRGKRIFSTTQAALVQRMTQGNTGGMTEIYLTTGTYVKSFYTVMCMPSAVKISMMGTSSRRIHHHVNWNRCVPCILSDKYKRGDES